MGTKVHCKSYYPPGHHSMRRDLNQDSSSSNWPVFCGDKSLTNGHYCNNGFMPSNIIIDGYHPGYDKDSLKQQMLEHEAVFKNQVHELHRVYRIQMNMMEEVKGKEVHNHNRASIEPSSSSNLQVLPLQEDARKWHMAGFPLLNSPSSCTNTPTGPFPFQNGSSFKDSEALDISRPFKVRKKLFDLQLPAVEYIDTEQGEKLNEHNKVSSLSSYSTPNLNEPVQIQEEMTPSVYFLGQPLINGENKGIPQAAKLNGYHEAGSSKSNHRSTMPQGFRQDKWPLPSYPVQGTFNPLHHNPPTGYSREDLWREGTNRGLESSRSRLEPVEAGNSFPFFTSASFANSKAQSDSSRKPTSSSFVQNITTFESLGRGFQPIVQSQEFSGRKWVVDGSSPFLGSDVTKPNGFHQGSASGSKEVCGGFDYLNCSSRGDNIIASDRSISHGIGSSSKGPRIDINLNEVVSNKVVILQDLNTNSMPDDHLSTLPWLRPKPDYAIEAKRSEFSKVRDLNQIFTPKVTMLDSSDDCEIIETRNVKKILGFPIFETGGMKNNPSSLASTSANLDCPPQGKKVENEIKKEMMIDINVEYEPDEPIIAAEESIVDKEKLIKSSTRGIIDLNNTCDSDYEESPLPSSYEIKNAHGRISLDINLEAPVLADSEDYNNTPSKENTPDGAQETEDDVLRDAAETILCISSFCPKTDINNSICHSSEASLVESFQCFVDAVFSCANELDMIKNSSENDEFEVMTLQLQETKEEDYMPKPFIPEIEEKVEAANMQQVQTRTRRGQARRGGRRGRDFQRDILPGMTTLSRNEVTEDIQTFSGLMKATGHSWSSGLTRRNGGGRGRKRGSTAAIVSPRVCDQVNNNNNSMTEVCLEDKRSLTGWGKTTRRPRRQRCPPAGNLSTVVST
ncbi:hypothetical protein ACJIZ3_005398 [Penstemon smallii]|uniref:Uncharacterized protein n=1 Tax=Penstemon smallii TaxID=265156 RepID=A0ABD3S545_9LAMI